MAPPISRRSKQNTPNSPPHPIPLPGIALGMFAAIAAGFAASRALRRKRPAQSLQDEKQSISAGTPVALNPLLVQEREIEIKEKDDSFNASAHLMNANGTITIVHEAPKLAAGLKPVFDATQEVSFTQKRDARPFNEGRRETEEEKGEEGDCGNGQREEAEKEDGEFEENEKKKGEIMENWQTSGEEGEIADITAKIEAFVVDEASVEALRNLILDEKEEEEEEGKEEEKAEGKGEEVDDDGVMDADEDTGDDGDDDRSSADQQPSPVFINGRILNFFEEIPDSDLLSSGSNSLSDAVSESSMQEVSSAPVKPFVPTEETLEASWSRAKAESFVALNQPGQENTLAEDKNWSDNGKNLLPLEDGLSGMNKKVPDFVENLSQADQTFIELKHGWPVSNDETLHLKPSEQDVDVGLLNLKPVLVEIEEKESSVDKVNQIKFEILSDVTNAKGISKTLECEVLIKVNGLDEGIAESTMINGKVPSNGSPLPEELDDLDSIGESEHVLHSTREIADNFIGLTCEEEKIAESTRINGKVLLDESVMTTDDSSSQTGQEGIDGTISDVHDDPDLLAAIELSDNNTCVRSEDELYEGESTQEAACLVMEASEKLVVVEDILEEPAVLQPAAQKCDIVDGASAENNVNLEQEQSSLFLASKGSTEGKELSCEASTDNVEVSSGREDINDGLSEQTLAEGRIYEKEQEIEEITSSGDPNDLIFETKNLLTESTIVSYNDTREGDYLVSKEGAAHHYGLQTKGGFPRKVLQYLPLEMGFICLGIALVSFMLWYLEVSPLIHS